MIHSTSTDVLVTRTEGAVLVLTINNPATRNSIGPEFFAAATDALAMAVANPAIGAIVITGAGDFFSSGGNLKQLAATRDLTPEQRRTRLEMLHELIRTIRRCPKPVISAVEGGAAGAGMSLALAGDLLVAASNAFFAASYIKAGLTPDGGLTALLAESLPRQLMTQICLTGERVGAQRMHDLGVVTTLSEPGSAESEAIALGQQLAQGPERATGRILELCRTAPTLPLEDQLDREAVAMVDSMGDPEAAEGIASVLGRRATDFVSLRGQICK